MNEAPNFTAIFSLEEQLGGCAGPCATVWDGGEPAGEMARQLTLWT